MPYSIRLPDGTLVDNIPDEVTPQQAKSRIVAQYPQFAPPEDSSFLRQAADIPLGFTKGLYGGAEMISNLFGAESEVSQNLRGIQGYLNSLMSAQARMDQQEIARIMKDAEDKGVADQVLAGVKAFATAPIDTMTQALGTTAPALIGGLAATLFGAPAAIGIGVGAGLGSMMGAGTVKGTIYEETKQTLLDAGMSPEQAEARAVLAQEYGGKNLDQILAGAALGGIASATGLEKSLIGPVARRIIGKAAAENAAEEAVKRGLVSRVGRGAVAEAAPEFAQAAQEQLAANLAAQREGIDVPTMRGVISSGTLEALAGAPLGGLGGALEGGPRAAKPEAEVTTTEAPPQEQVISSVPSVDDEGNPVDVSIVRTPDGEIVARRPDGEEVNVGNLVEDPNNPEQIQAAVADVFGEAPVTEVAAPEEAKIPEAEKVAPEIPTTAAEQVEAPVSEVAAPEIKAEPVEQVKVPKAEEPKAPEETFFAEELPEADFKRLARLKPAELPIGKPPVTEESVKLEQAEKELSKAERGPGKLFGMLRGKLDPRDVKDISPDFEYRALTSKNKGRFVSDFVSEGALDQYLPEGKRSQDPGFDEQDATEYIKDKLRSKQYKTAETDMEAQIASEKLSKAQREAEEAAQIDEINKMAEEAAIEDQSIPEPPRYSKQAIDKESSPLLSEAQREGYSDTVLNHSKDIGGTPVYEGDGIALIRGYNMYGDPVYSGVNTKTKTRTRTDVRSSKADIFTPEQYAILKEKVEDAERADKEAHAAKPFVQFKNGVAFSESISPELAGVVSEWKSLLNLKPNIYIGTIQDVAANKDKYTGPHRAIASGALDQRENGSMRRMQDGSYYVLFSKSDNTTKMLEVIAHELGHVHEREVFVNADKSMKEQLVAEHRKWLESQKGKTAKDLVESLRARQTAKMTRAPEGLMAKDMSGYGSYWTSFSEWYADQVSRWAVSNKAPLTAVEKFFKRLANQLRRFYQSLKTKGYLPNETFAEYLNDAAKNADIKPASKAEIDQQMDLFASQPSIGKVEAKTKVAPQDNAARGKVALNVIEELGRAPQPETTKAEWVKAAINSAVENPKVTADNAKERAKKFLDMIETKAFSSDAALNNQIRRSLQDSFKDNPEAMGTLLQISTSQAVHDDALANQFMQMGGLEYDPEVYKYKAVEKKENLKALVEQLVKIANKYGLTQEQAQRVAHTAFEAKRLSSLKQFNDELKLKIDALRKDARNLPTESGRAAARAEIRRQTKNFKYIHMTDGQIASGLNLFDTIPELTNLVDTWNGMRENAVKELVDSGLWSQEGAESMLENVDYVPFYREDQLEKNEGPKEFLRSYLVQAREKKLKGSDKPVNDIFDNMARWTQYAIKRAVRNRQALAMVDAAVDAGIAKEVKSRADGKNVIRVWREGEEVFYDMADPLFMEAFKGLESVALPGWKFMAKLSNLLRQSVVLYPLFSVSQVPQDSFAAMLTSGLKTRQALKIPIIAVKEFVTTIANRSKIHDQLKKYGAVGVKDFSAAIARNDAEIMAGLKGDRKFWGKVKDLLEHISMASDNAVRQAVYSVSKSAGLSEAEAVEKAFQLINFRNKGSSKRLAVMGQVIPFFNAYLAAQHVALKTISGRGISPQVRGDALKTLAATTASVMALSLIYAMMVGGDDDYEDTPQAIRDRTFMIPGTSLRIPIRADVFSIPKILTENLYMLMTDKGSMDGRKFRDSMGSALFNAVSSPTVVPQAFKPAVEVLMNYNFFQQRPLIGTYQKGLELERQFNDSTSEFSKVLGQTGLVSPIVADHLIRGMLGSAGGLFLAVTNPIIDSGTDVKAPSMDLHDMIAALPGTSAFVARPNQNALKADFYVLRDEVSKVVNTLNDLKARSPDEIDKFLENEDNINKLGLQKAVNKITQQLSKIRREISRINNATDMSPAEKKAAIQEMRDIEKDMLKDLDIKELRKMANL